MPDLTTEYMGLSLKNPIIAGSCGLTNSVESIKKLEANGAAAVVLKSLFEEQILMEVESLKSDQSIHTEELDYIAGYNRQHNLDEYLSLVSNAKKAVSIPVIPSINCASANEWTSFASRLQDAGADGLELNIYIMPGNIKQKSEEIEKIYFDIIREVRKHITVPVSVKIGSYFTGLANMIFSLSLQDIGAIIMFNRFHQPDINLDKMALSSADIFSSPEENLMPRRWIGMLSHEVKCDLVATTGIHDGHTVLKNILAGAAAVQIATILYKKGPEVINEMLQQVEEWMNIKNISSIKEITGELNQANVKDPVIYERSQFMRYFSNAKI